MELKNTKDALIYDVQNIMMSITLDYSFFRRSMNIYDWI